MNPDELARLIDTHAAPLELFARQWCDDPADVVQAAFVRLIEQDERPEQPAAWLYRVVRNDTLMQRRSDRRRQKREGHVCESIPAWFEQSFGDGVDSVIATQALQEISDEYREVVIARFWGALTFEEIGEMTGTSSSTAHRRYLDGVELLRKKLGVSCQNE
ncbi:MAG: RNA polymerase sigma factor [Planctomycetaceae bacterium]